MFRVVDVTLDNAYAAGGYTLDPQKLGFGLNGRVHVAICSPVSGFVLEYAPATSKLFVRDHSGAAGAVAPEVPNNAAALSGLVTRVLAFGDGHG